ncbi:methyl-CpG-binding domain-containing protein 6-like [Solanum pennellii]|uniref:Methyl-CpG-binding domain-containing protein 6-like n=1 Tax=Solanum pennellii TaxID=28526 RepID=A0ABM1H8D5_SOLPN|nr:methyl-CpG-binding domain-containing protein 6-like [Solanum pennellii]
MSEVVAESTPAVEPVLTTREVNTERPSWLPEDWRFKSVVRMAGAAAGLIDNYYFEPHSGKRFRSKTAVLDFLKRGVKRKTEIVGASDEFGPRRSKRATQPYKLFEGYV